MRQRRKDEVGRGRALRRGKDEQGSRRNRAKERVELLEEDHGVDMVQPAIAR